MEKKSNTSITVAKIVVLLLCAVNVISSVVKFVDSNNPSTLFGVVLNCLTVYYMFVAYKNPHGNLLRYLLILATLESVFTFWYTFTIINRPLDAYDLCPLLEIAVVAYLSGRLNKYKEDIILFIIALILLLIVGIHSSANFTMTSLVGRIAPFEKFTMLLALFVSYIARYKEHIEAGIEEDKK